MSSNYIDRAKEVFDTEIAGVVAVRDLLGESFEQLVDLCLATTAAKGKLVITGIGKSGYIGKKMAATLSSVGTPSIFMHPVEARHGDLGFIQENDLLVALSYSGETDELLVVLPPAKRLGVKLVSITASAGSRLGKMSDLVIEMPVPREACPFNLAPTTTTTALLVLGDALALVLMDARGFTKENYGCLHPGGAIGRMVTMSAEDMMRPADECALVSENDDVWSTMQRMCASKAGSAVVVDAERRLLGIFTDGDLRRLTLDKRSVPDMLMRDVMTKNPVCVTCKMTAGEVLGVLGNRRIDDLIVVDADKRVVGVIDVQDLPGFKVM